MFRIEPRVEQREHGKRRVPHRRLARLDAAALLVLDRECVETCERALDDGMVERVAERMQRDDRPDPRRLDASPGAVRLLALDDPSLGRAQGPAAHRRDGLPLVGMQAAVEEGEEARPRLDRQRIIGAGAELLDAERDCDLRAQGRRDRQRYERLARPAAERIDGERSPRGEEDLLGREHGHLLPRPERQQREPHAREHPRVLDAAGIADELRGGAHVRRVGRVAGEAKRDVGLHGRRQIRRSGEEGRPASVVALLRADPAGGRFLLVRRDDAEEVADEEILGVDRHVGLELALPPAVGVLEAAQVLAAA